MNIFNSVKLTKPKRNKFNLTHDVKMSGKMGNLMPCALIEAVPGDTFNISSDAFVRFAPMQAPIMHRVDVSCHYFFVPNRIVWDNWEKFITNDDSAPEMPLVEITDAIGPDNAKFLDYLGVPPIQAGGTATQLNAIPMAAYQAVYNDYYRDENLVAEVDYKLTDGVQSTNKFNELTTLRKRAWEHDYFTAALPFAQKGAAVDIPIGEIELKDDWADASTPKFKNEFGTVPFGQNNVVSDSTNLDIEVGGDHPMAYDPDGSLKAGSTTINELRRAFRLQEWLEKNARGGTRYIENILAHFGVKSSDKRLQRPEYITGVKSPVVISEVLNTAGPQTTTSISNVQGAMAGHGVSVSAPYNGKYYVEEHGYIIGICSVMPKPAYQQGIPKTFLKNDPLEYFWPSFAHIGEQEVQNQELYAYTPDKSDTFGYIPRYAEYKYMPSRVAGDFRDDLKYWHLGRIFNSQPTLSQDFIECSSEETARIFAVTDDIEDQLYMDVLNKITAVRPMPVYGNPNL